ncbi:MAG: hypothetical protein GX446_19370 [Chthonomonadales bacterium]|nr:hypothetical protein [Chthonomonadales bacterium]
MNVRPRPVWSAAALIVLYVAIQTFAAIRLPITGDELNVLGIAGEYARSGAVRSQAPGSETISHTPAGVLVHAVYSLGGLIAPSPLAGRMLALALALLGAGVVTATLRREVSGRFALWFLAAYGVAPWTMYHASQVWEAGLMMLITAFAMAAAVRLRRSASSWASGAIGWALAASFQAYASFAVVIIGYAIQALRRQVRVAWIAFAIGAAVGSVTLWPPVGRRPLDPIGNAVATKRHPGARFGYGLRHGYPIVRAAGFWLRMSSSDLNRQVRENRLYREAQSRHDVRGLLLLLALNGSIVLSFGSVLISAAATGWYFRGRREEGEPDAHAWLRSHCMAMCAALLIASALSPVCAQGYHAVAALPAASLPFAAWCERTWASGSRRWQAAIVIAFALRVAVAVIVALGNEVGVPRLSAA